MEKLEIVFLVLCAFLQGVGQSRADGQSMRFAFPEFPPLMKLSESLHPAATFIRTVSANPLLKRLTFGGQRQSSLELVEQIEFSAQDRMIRMKLRKDLYFPNSAPCGVEDVLFSLAYCSRLGWLQGIESYASSEGKSRAVQGWIQIKPRAGETLENALDAVSKCPVYEAQTAQTFGDDFGYGTNLLGLGPFVLSTFAQGRSFTLRRSAMSPTRTEGPRELVVLGVPDVERALSGLRGGDIDVIFVSDENEAVLRKARTDGTLLVSRCGDDTLISRRELAFECRGELRVNEMHYHY